MVVSHYDMSVLSMSVMCFQKCFGKRNTGTLPWFGGRYSVNKTNRNHTKHNIHYHDSHTDTHLPR